MSVSRILFERLIKKYNKKKKNGFALCAHFIIFYYCKHVYLFKVLTFKICHCV